MVKLKGFTITETLISMALFGISVFISNILVRSIYSQPNRSDLIEINQCIKRISECRNTYEFEKEIDRIELKHLNISYDIEYLDHNSICHFDLNKGSKTLFSHFIVLPL